MAQTTLMPERVTEAAVAALISALNLADVQVLTRFAGDNQELPAVLVTCDQCQPDYQDDVEAQTGNWICSVKITLKSHMEDTTGAEHDELMGQLLFGLFHVEIVAELNAAIASDEFTALKADFGPRQNSTDGQHWTTEQELIVYMMPS